MTRWYSVVAFLGKNCDFPFWVKWKVMDSALLSAILYGCEGWILNSAVVAQKNYLEIVKALLGVRTSSPNDTCLIELGIPSVTARVKAAQQKFIRKLIRERQQALPCPLVPVELAGWPAARRRGPGKNLVPRLAKVAYYAASSVCSSCSWAF